MKLLVYSAYIIITTYINIIIIRPTIINELPYYEIRNQLIN